MKSEDISVVSQSVADAFGVATFEAVRPSRFEGKRPDDVPVQWELDESGQLVGVEMVDSKSNYGCGVWLQKGEWSCGVYKPFDDIMADGLTALGFDEDVIGVYRPKMTQQEAQAWCERLTRIWVPESLKINERVYGPHWEFRCGEFHFNSCITDQVRFVMSFHENKKRKGYHLGLTREIVHWDEERDEYEEPRTTVTGDLCVSERGNISSDLMTPPGEEAIYAQFADEWLPFFRRGCWLSGVPIEASMHEKAEWMQGFGQEELDAWSLKF